MKYTLAHVVNGFCTLEEFERQQNAEPIYVIFDQSPNRLEGGQTYHYGDGDWGDSLRRAKRYATEERARQEIEDLDPERILRDRLVVLAKTRAEVYNA
jgi:hypothetical protein